MNECTFAQSLSKLHMLISFEGCYHKRDFLRLVGTLQKGVLQLVEGEVRCTLKEGSGVIFGGKPICMVESVS